MKTFNIYFIICGNNIEITANGNNHEEALENGKRELYKTKPFAHIIGYLIDEI